MATNHTENYGLNLWEATDTFLRTEFNENTQKLDAALKAEADARAAGDAALQTAVNGKADASAVAALTQTVAGKADAAALSRKFGADNLPWVTGTYTGNADESSGEQHIALGFRPTLLVVIGAGKFGLGVSHEGSSQGVCSYYWETSHGSISFSGDLLEITADGFTARRAAAYQNYTINQKGVQYLYFALR